MKNLIVNSTIELVGYGHPDRFADYLAELILFNHLKQDKNAKVAVEIIVTRDAVFLGGEIKSIAKLDYNDLIYGAIEKVYGEKWWSNYKEIKIFNFIAKQSVELQAKQEHGIVAADQGVIYGYYDKERFLIINKLYKIMDQVKKEFQTSPDWKLLYNFEKKELSMSLCGKIDFLKVKEYIEKISQVEFEDKLNIIVNPSGEWLISGPLSDTGVVGRKLMIDTFGAGIPHGGGAFCGKDPSKVDKTGVIIGSYLAKEIALVRNVTRVLVEINYKIGDELPKAYAYFENGKKLDISDNVNLTLDQYINTYKLKEEDWSQYVLKGGIISYLERK